jgi:tetratricopeptide (TPR) repeat protein
MTEASAPTGTLSVAMKHASRLLEADPVLAAEQVREILKAVPNHPPAMLLLGTAHCRAGNLPAALAVLEPLVRAQPNWASAHFEYGLALGAAGRGDEAVRALRKAVELKPQHPRAWRALADHLLAIGDSQGGDAAYMRHVQCSAQDPALQQSAAAMLANDIPTAERLLKAHLQQVPTDVPAIRMLAEVAVRLGRNEDARKLLERCLELAPGFSAARYNYAVLLHRQNDSSGALVQVEHLLKSDPRSPSHRNLHAVILSRIGEYERSSQVYAQLLAEYPDNSKVWLSYGHVLKTEGRQAECIDAYRRSIALDPAFGEAYWSLANLKTFRFTEADLAAMRTQLARADLSDENRLHFEFALGKACEDTHEHAQAFEHYAKGNALHRAGHPYDADLNTSRVKRLKASFTREFFRERAGMGCDAPDPIFIVGMPRAGSTLLEQILSSHSAVEGTTELPDIVTMAKELRAQSGSQEIVAYAEALAAKSAAELRALGEEYLERTRIHRKTDRPFFIDKMPNNFLHVGLIQVILPNAKIIDARRHPLGCCFSNFKQYYARGQNFSYGLADMGRFYRDYVELMAHFDEVLPGRVHRVFYERTIEDTEGEVRRVLDYCGLPFEPGCLRFFENDRAVRTASAEQVRQPIYRDGMEQWRHYEAWLDPLKEALGPVLDAYPEVPRF